MLVYLLLFFTSIVVINYGNLNTHVNSKVSFYWITKVYWNLQVQRYYGFQPLTAYLAVNYMDRFLNCHSLPEVKKKEAAEK